MASKHKSPARPGWHLSFDISPNVTLTSDRQPCHRATAIARHGDLSFMAELELVNWAEDIAAFFSRARLVFINGAPDFPDQLEEAPGAEAADSTDAPVETETDHVPLSDVPIDEEEVYEEGDDGYDITFYPAEGSTEEVDPAQPSLW